MLRGPAPIIFLADNFLCSNLSFTRAYIVILDTVQVRAQTLLDHINRTQLTLTVLMLFWSDSTVGWFCSMIIFDIFLDGCDCSGAVQFRFYGRLVLFNDNI